MLLMDIEVAELDKRRKQFADRKISREEFQAFISATNQIVKCARFDLDVQIARKKHGRGLEKMIKESNILSGSQILELSVQEVNIRLNCPYHEDSVSREECLDYSEKEENIEDCQKCEHFSSTRSIMLPEYNQSPTSGVSSGVSVCQPI